ncbi:hypothetical protein C0991_005931 [Blastosporella zonata]|nr:hypothetical protein C0991_005931 [Blastosporella zonata]
MDGHMPRSVDSSRAFAPDPQRGSAFDHFTPPPSDTVSYCLLVHRGRSEAILNSLPLYVSRSPTSSATDSLSESTSTSTSSTGSASSSLPTSTTSSNSTTSTSLSSTSSSLPTSTPSPTPTPQSSIFETTSNGQVHTITSFVDPSPAASASASTTAAPPTAFLKNKALSGTVFALVGIFALVIILAVVTFTIRRKRNAALLREAISFDPASGGDHYRDSAEKRRISTGFGANPRSSGYHHTNNSDANTLVYPFGQGYGHGQTDRGGMRVPQQPARARSPQGHRGPGRASLEIGGGGHREGFGWAPDMAPFMSVTPARPS